MKSEDKCMVQMIHQWPWESAKLDVVRFTGKHWECVQFISEHNLKPCSCQCFQTTFTYIILQISLTRRIHCFIEWEIEWSVLLIARFITVLHLLRKLVMLVQNGNWTVSFYAKTTNVNGVTILVFGASSLNTNSFNQLNCFFKPPPSYFFVP